MKRRKSEQQKRFEKRRNKLIMKMTLKFAAPFTAIIVAGGALLHNIKNLDVFGGKNYEDYILPSIEETIETPEKINSNIVEKSKKTQIIVDKIISERDNLRDENGISKPKIKPEDIIPEITIPEITIPEEIEPEEIIGTDLLDMGFEFENIDFERLISENQDTVGWIHIDETNVEYPIMQGVDNEYYIHHDNNGNYSEVGSIYLDANNTSFDTPTYDLKDLNFIYGHHVTKGRMFSTICNYKEQDFYERVPFFVIYTPEGYAYKADVFAGVIYEGKDNSMYNDNYNFDDEQDFVDYMNYLKENSLISSDLSVEYGDKIVALVTCSYENGRNGDLRFVVFARLSKQYTNELQREEGARLGLYK